MTDPGDPGTWPASSESSVEPLPPDLLGDLSAEHARLLQFVYLSPIGIVRCTAAGRITAVNAVATALLLAVDPTDPLTNLFELLAPFDHQLISLVNGDPAPVGTVCAKRRVRIQPETRLALDVHPGPEVLAVTMVVVAPDDVMVVIDDISAEVRNERQVREDGVHFRMIYEGVREYAFFTADPTGLINSWNVSGERMSGYTEREVLGRPFASLWSHGWEPSPDWLGGALRRGWAEHEGWCERTDGRRFWGEAMTSIVQDDDNVLTGFAVVLRDATERKEFEDRLHRLATTDELTGLANRRHFLDVTRSHLDSHRRYGQALSLIMLDVDWFKRINDTYGHAAGDAVLRRLAQVCRHECRNVDVVGRIGGEEFAVLLPSTDGDAAAIVAERIRSAVERATVPAAEVRLSFTVSLGVAEAGPGAETVGALLTRADEVLYLAKHEGRNRVVVAGAE